MKNIEWYELSALLFPGGLVLYGFSLFYPELGLIVFNKNFSLGDFGLFTILSSACGHIIQGFGNIIEWIWWKFTLKPTDLVRNKKNTLLSEIQTEKLIKDIPIKLNLNKNVFDIKTLNNNEWYGITRQIYASLDVTTQTKRIDGFNAAYGLSRGIFTALLLLSLTAIFQNKIYLFLILLGLSLIMFFRMVRFGKNYARELFVQFLQIK